MTQLHAQESATISAPPDAVHGLLVDYRGSHAQVLPRQYFKEYTVEEGGRGAGTIFRTRIQVMGQSRWFRMRVSEPEPGRVLRESDLVNDTVTTFTLEPADGGRTRLTIASEWSSPPGFAGWLDRLFTPGVTRRIYRTELAQIEAYVLRSPREDHEQPAQ